MKTNAVESTGVEFTAIATGTATGGNFNKKERGR